VLSHKPLPTNKHSFSTLKTTDGEYLWTFGLPTNKEQNPASGS